jgi:RIO kinase 1
MCSVKPDLPANSSFDSDLDSDLERDPIVVPATRNPKPPAPEKTSFERSPEVQRWLEEQALPEGGMKPEFRPTFLAHQRDRLWVLSSLAHFYEDDLISDVLRVVKSGKEATVYCCAAEPTTGMEYAAAKVYRPRMFRSLKNDARYREGRAQLDEEGHELWRPRRQRGEVRLTDRGRAARVSSWITYEHQTQQLLYEAGADVPRPLAQVGNAVLMEHIGDGSVSAPLLREVELDREETQPLFERILRNIELFLACERIHGDLSAYNILYWDGEVRVIDFAQAVDPRYSDDGYALLARDVARLCQYFARYGVAADAGVLAETLWLRYLDGAL